MKIKVTHYLELETVNKLQDAVNAEKKKDRKSSQSSVIEKSLNLYFESINK